MPCISVQFNPTIGPVSNLLIAKGGTLRASSAAGQSPPLLACPLLFDTGADRTCISPQVAQQLGLKLSGKVNVTVPTGKSSANTYLADVGVPFGDPTTGAEVMILENLLVMEFSGGSPHYQGLVGRDILARGLFSMAGWDTRFTFCL